MKLEKNIETKLRKVLERENAELKRKQLDLKKKQIQINDISGRKTQYHV